MKTYKFLLLNCMLLSIFGCSTDTIDVDPTVDSSDISLDIKRYGGGLSSPQTPFTIYIEWEEGVTSEEKEALRDFYSQWDYLSGLYPVKNGYLIEWEQCLSDRNIERWVVNFCGGCNPFHDPGDHARIGSTSFDSIDINCGI